MLILLLLLLLLLLLCHMPSGTRAKLPCEAKKEQQSKHHTMHIVMSIFSINLIFDIALIDRDKGHRNITEGPIC